MKRSRKRRKREEREREGRKRRKSGLPATKIRGKGLT